MGPAAFKPRICDDVKPVREKHGIPVSMTRQRCHEILTWGAVGSSSVTIDKAQHGRSRVDDERIVAGGSLNVSIQKGTGRSR